MNYIGEKKDLKQEVADKEKAKKTWMYIGIGASVAFAGALIWALVK